MPNAQHPEMKAEEEVERWVYSPEWLEVRVLVPGSSPTAGELVCMMATGPTYRPKPYEQRARLIAGAPDLVRALGWFINDPRFQIGVGGNPIAVDRMIADAKEIYARATGASS